MFVEYILVGAIFFSIGHSSGKQKQCKHGEKIVVVHKYNKHRFHKKWKNYKRRHTHKNFTLEMMCRNDWKF